MDNFSKSPLRMCSVFFQSRWEILSCFPDVNFATLTRDLVYSRSVAGIRFILVVVEKFLKFVGGGVVDLYAWSLCDVEPK